MNASTVGSNSVSGNQLHPDGAFQGVAPERRVPLSCPRCTRFKWLGALSAILLAVGLAGCEEPETNVRLTSRERIQIDTIATRQIDSLRYVMDSVCITDYPGIMRRALDSLLKLRRAEEEILRARIQRELQEQ